MMLNRLARDSTTDVAARASAKMLAHVTSSPKGGTADDARPTDGDTGGLASLAVKLVLHCATGHPGVSCCHANSGASGCDDPRNEMGDDNEGIVHHCGTGLQSDTCR